MLNRAEEDYIKAIYELTVERGQELIKSSEVSAHFSFTDQTVNEMIKKLVHKKLINFLPYKGLNLTKKGKDEAIRMVRSHRIWEVFLTQELGFNWSDVHEHAETLEHASSSIVLDRLNKYLNYPEYCQHGNPIPKEDGSMAVMSHISLDEVKQGTQIEVVRVLDHKELLNYLNERNIKLHDKFSVLENDRFGDLVKISNGADMYIISGKIAKMLYVKMTA